MTAAEELYGTFACPICGQEHPHNHGEDGVAAYRLALLFHESYERLAPFHGYRTRTQSRFFDPRSRNGRLMIAVCGELLDHFTSRNETAPSQTIPLAVFNEMAKVRVTSCDFNGESFDGRPFDWGTGEMPTWLAGALGDGSIKVEPDDRDYAVWRVLTGDNRHKIAEPGDWIVSIDGRLHVLSDKTTWDGSSDVEASDPEKAGGHWPDGSGLDRDGEGAAEELSPLWPFFRGHYWDSLEEHRSLILAHVQGVLIAYAALGPVALAPQGGIS